jgi:hypothetical protein
MPISVDRSTERSTLLREMRTDGTIATRMVVIPCISIEMELYEQGFPPANATHAHRKEDFVTGELCEQSTRVFLIY